MSETRYGGRFYKDSWLLTSIEQSDFILANMIVCLEVNFLLRQLPRVAMEQNLQDAEISYSHSDLITALQKSHAYLAEARTKSEESRVAYDVLAVVLRKFPEGQHAGDVSQRAVASNMDDPVAVGPDDGKSGSFFSFKSFSHTVHRLPIDVDRLQHQRICDWSRGLRRRKSGSAGIGMAQHH